MSELAAVVFDDQPAATDFRLHLEALNDRRVLLLEGLAVLRRGLDDRVTLQPTPASDLCPFWGLLVGLVLWPHWLGMAPGMPSGPVATLDSWGLDPDWAAAVATSVEPGDVAVLFLADGLPGPVLEAVRRVGGDLFHLRLTEQMKVSLTEAFGGSPTLNAE